MPPLWTEARRLSFDSKALTLYAITDRRWLAGRTLESQVEAAIKGGATMVQLREKHLDDKDFLEEAFRIKEVCHQYGVPFVVNDNVEVARKVGADGVHVGQSDMEAGAVRELVGSSMFLGVSAETVDEALLAQSRGADYLGVGAVFPTGSKDDAIAVSHQTLCQICEDVRIPVVAIGGITPDNICELAGSGIAGISVISAIFAQPDAEVAARDLRRRTEEMLRA